MTESVSKKRRRRQPEPEVASKSRPGPKSNKQQEVLVMLRQPNGATIEEIADQVGWAPSAITRIVQWLLFCTRASVREIIVQKRPDGTTVYKAA